jgi:tRNA(Ile)-lysidine synthetase-like protein
MDRKALEERIAKLRSRGEVKAFVREIETDPQLEKTLRAIAGSRGVEVELPFDARAIVRQLRGREDESRRRKNPRRLDGGFVCVNCGAAVPSGGARVRDHCPFCLRGLHVDDVPGDRASTCGGLLVPDSFSIEGRAGVVIAYRCAKCGAVSRNRAHGDDHLPVQVGGTGTAPPELDLPYAEARTLPRRVLEVIKRERLWDAGDPIVVAVSGGLDSTVLLELLVELQDAHRGVLSVVSFDHGLRPAATHEVAVVGRIARAHGLDFRAVRLDLSPGPNLHDRARAARRAALADAPIIALGQHEDDQAETVLGNLLRGAGTTGLGGMLVKDPPFVRPLLFERRDVLEAWARTEGLSWVEDPSNADSRRGRMRELWPALDDLQGDARGALARAARLLARDDAFLVAATDEAWSRWERECGLAWEAVRTEHPALALRLLRRLAGDVPVSAVQLEAALLWEPKEGGALPLSEGWSLVYSGGVLRLRAPG